MKPTLCLLALAFAPAAHALDWKPEAELGLVNTTGNSDTTSARGKFALAGEDARWTHEHALSALWAEESGETTAERFELATRIGRKFGERQYAGLAGRYEDDAFSSYDHQATLAFNYGAWLLRDERRKLQLEGGPGVRRAKPSDGSGVERDVLLRGLADYSHQLTDTTRFFNTLLVESGEDNTFAQNDIGLTVSINASLALKASLQARHNTEVPAGTERTDTVTAVNIVWSPKPRE